MEIKFVALKVFPQYWDGEKIVDKFSVSGQRETDLNWSYICVGFETEERAIDFMIHINNEHFSGKLPMYDAHGFQK